MLNSIKTLKLVSGEEIIGTIKDSPSSYNCSPFKPDEYNNQYILLENVRVFITTNPMGNRMEISLIPWMHSQAMGCLRIYRNTIISISDNNIDSELYQIYQQSILPNTFRQ